MASSTVWQKVRSSFTLRHDYNVKPFAFELRSHTLFIIGAVAVGLFTDLFLYGLVVPILPYLLQDKVHLPKSQVQGVTSGLLAAYAAASVVTSPFAGILADKTSSRQAPFIGGLSALIVATVVLFTGSSVPALAFARVFQGASSAFVWTVGLALAMDTVGSENMGKTIGSIFSFISVGELFAPILGGVVYNKAGEGAVLGMSIGILVIDLVMRLLVIEKKVAKRYREAAGELSDEQDGSDSEQHDQNDNNNESDEESPLLNKDRRESDEYLIPEEYSNYKIYQKLPILYCLRNSSLALAWVVALTQATFISSFDGTIPTHATDVYGFDSLKSGLLFIPIGLMNLAIGPLAGWAVDKYGVKPGAVIGYGYLVPVLVLIRLPGPGKSGLIGYAIMLALCGVGLAVIGAPSIVEAGAVIDRYFHRNPEFFGGEPPYAQLYSINSMVFCLGLTLGPVIGGALTDTIGYGNMNAVLAVLSAVTAITSFIWLGGKPKILQSRKKK